MLERRKLSRRLIMLEGKFLNHTKEQRAHADRLSGESRNLSSLVKCQPAMQEFSIKLTAPSPSPRESTLCSRRKQTRRQLFSPGKKPTSCDGMVETAVFPGQEPASAPSNRTQEINA